MSAVTTIQLVHGDEDPTSVKEDLDRPTSEANEGVGAIQNVFKGVQAGTRPARVSVFVEDGTGTKASQTITCDQASTVDGTDELTIGGVTLSVVATATTQTHFLKGASSTAMATNMAAAINAHTTLKNHVSAAAATSVCTVTATMAGSIGNMIRLLETGAGMTLGAATLAGGSGTSELAPVTWNKGVA